jgi:hypothetical protein
MDGPDAFVDRRLLLEDARWAIGTLVGAVPGACGWRIDAKKFLTIRFFALGAPGSTEPLSVFLRDRALFGR